MKKSNFSEATSRSAIQETRPFMEPKDFLSFSQRRHWTLPATDELSLYTRKLIPFPSILMFSDLRFTHWLLYRVP
jgi:hypothetical protein